MGQFAGRIRVEGGGRTDSPDLKDYVDLVLEGYREDTTEETIIQFAEKNTSALDALTELKKLALFAVLTQEDGNFTDCQRNDVFRGLVESAKGSSEDSAESFALLELVQDGKLADLLKKTPSLLPEVMDLVLKVDLESARTLAKELLEAEVFVDLLKSNPGLTPKAMGLVQKAGPAFAQKLANQVLEANDFNLLTTAWPELPRDFSESAIGAVRQLLGLGPQKVKDNEEFQFENVLQGAYHRLQGIGAEPESFVTSIFLDGKEAAEILVVALSFPLERFIRESKESNFETNLNNYLSRDFQNVATNNQTAIEFKQMVSRCLGTSAEKAINELNSCQSGIRNMALVSDGLVKREQSRLLDAVNIKKTLLSSATTHFDNFYSLQAISSNVGSTASCEGRDLAITNECPRRYFTIKTEAHGPKKTDLVATFRDREPLGIKNLDFLKLFFDVKKNQDGTQEVFFAPIPIHVVTDKHESGAAACETNYDVAFFRAQSLSLTEVLIDLIDTPAPRCPSTP